MKFEITLSKILNRKHYVSVKKNARNLPDDFSVTFHAGAMKTKPNSIESIKAALDYGAKVVEFDVSFRPDGTAVIIHNGKPEDDEGVLLEDALAVVATDKECKINLDIKSTANLPEVDKLVKKFGLSERVFYTGVFEDWVETVKNTSAIPYYLNHNLTKTESYDENLLQELADKIISLGAIGLNSNFSNASAVSTRTMQKNGLLVSLWTANKAADMARVIACRPDNITTKNPHILLEMLR